MSMYSLIYQIFFLLKRIERSRRAKNKSTNRMLRFLTGYVEWFFNVPSAKWYANHPNLQARVTKVKRMQRVVVSLTTYPKRISTVWLTIETLLRQSVKPDEIILWLAEPQFPEGLSELPSSVLRLQDRGLTIRFCDDLRSHKKYFYALQEYAEDLVILADDDMFYPRDTIQKLLQMHKRWPEDICCITAQIIEPTFSAMPSVWRNPSPNEHTLQHTDRIQAFTGSGTLIPPKALPEEAFDKEAIRQLCPYADDLWITFMAHRNGTRLSTLKKWRPFPVSIYGTAEGSLYYINGEGNQNDVQWKNLLEHYGTLPDHCGVAAESEMKIEEHSRKDI